MIIKNNGLIYDYWSLISQSKIKKIKKIKTNLKYKGL